jgi:hypothetical protein
MVFEKSLGIKFPKERRLIGFVNPKSNRFLELDGFNRIRKIAFEYQGPHHYRDLYKDANGFRNHRFIFHIKRMLCRKLGIIFFSVPHYWSKERLRDHIKRRLNFIRIDPIGLGKSRSIVHVGNGARRA